MRVQDIMTRNPIIAAPSDTVSDALQLMRTNGFKHLPVLSKVHHLVGIVSLDDCRVHLNMTEADGPVPNSDSRLRDVMKRAPIVTCPADDVFQAAKLMYANHIHALPVMVDETLVGIITTSDLLVACIQLTRKVAVGSPYS